jgi:enoyl-CoA hydratase
MTIDVDRQGEITIVTLDREDRRNAVDRPTAEALADAFRTFEEDEDAKVAVLHGEHGTFCSGADLKAVSEGNPNRLEPDGDGPMGPSRMLLDKPVIASLEGHAVAGGLELALWCDLRVAAEDATLGVFCRRWGVPLIDGGTVRLPRLIGLSRALDLIMTGRPVDATEARQIGLVNRVAPSGGALDVAIDLARRIASFPQICMNNDRLSAYEQGGMSLDDALANEFERGMTSMASGAHEGAKRFAEGAGRHGEFE